MKILRARSIRGFTRLYPAASILIWKYLSLRTVAASEPLLYYRSRSDSASNGPTWITFYRKETKV